MTKDELMETKSIAIEKYANGFILADYSGNRGQFGAAYAGKSLDWNDQPIVRDPFDTEEDAIKAGLES